MTKSLADRLDAVERKPLKYGAARTSEVFVRGGDIFEQARNAAQMTREQAAEAYGVSATMLKFPEPAQPTLPPQPIVLYQVPCGICGVISLADTEGAALRKWARHRITKHESWRGTPTDKEIA